MGGSNSAGGAHVQAAGPQFTGTMLQTINNPDGTVSIIHIDTGPSGNSVVTLPDGTQATVVHAVSAGPHPVNMTVSLCVRQQANTQANYQSYERLIS